MKLDVRIGLTIVFGVAAHACGDDKGSTGTGETATAVIGSGGGELAIEGATLTVPAGALAGDETISITSTKRDAPSGYESYSPIYELGPEGLTFEAPVTIELAFTGDAAKAKLYWSKLGDTSAFEALAGTAVGGSMRAPVTHFSVGFVGALEPATTDDVADASGETEDDTGVATDTGATTGTTATDTGATSGDDTGVATDTGATSGDDTGVVSDTGATTEQDTSAGDTSGTCVTLAGQCQAGGAPCCVDPNVGELACDNGYCLPPCGGPGEPCTKGGGCCAFADNACHEASGICVMPSFCVAPGGTCSQSDPSSPNAECCGIGQCPQSNRCCYEQGRSCVGHYQCCSGNCNNGSCTQDCTATGQPCVGNAQGTDSCCNAADSCIDGLKLLAEANEPGVCGVRCRVQTESCTTDPADNCCQGLVCGGIPGNQKCVQ